MLTLSLFRHAKSSWEDASQEDFDRPLAPRGRKSAPAMAAFMKKRGLCPDLVLCSSSTRTRETLALLADKIGKPPVQFVDALYLASPETLLACLHGVDGNPPHVMIVGHNPGLQEFASALIGSGNKADRAALAAKLPTAALVTMTFAARRWRDIKPGAGALTGFMTPKRLP